MLFIVLVCNLIDNVIRDSIGLGENVNLRAAGIGSLAYFIFLCLCITVIPCVALCFMELIKLKLFVQLLVASLYYFGDNIDYFVLRYSNHLNCSDSCIKGVEITRQATLGTALIIIHTLPIFDKDDDERGFDILHYLFNVTTVLIKIDMIFTVVTAVVQTDLDCSITNRALGWLLFSFATIIGWISIICHTRNGDKELKKDDGQCIRYTFIFLLLISVPFHLLSDNRQPLDCEFNCVVNLNGTTTYSCDREVYICRIVFSVSTAFSVLFVSVVVLGYDYLCSKKK